MDVVFTKIRLFCGLAEQEIPWVLLGSRLDLAWVEVPTAINFEILMTVEAKLFGNSWSIPSDWVGSSGIGHRFYARSFKYECPVVDALAYITLDLIEHTRLHWLENE